MATRQKKKQRQYRHTDEEHDNYSAKTQTETVSRVDKTAPDNNDCGETSDDDFSVDDNGEKKEIRDSKRDGVSRDSKMVSKRVIC